ncbi:MAG: hypothetical protein NC253_08955 [Ruminococcus sp.]|nr:hypothetical protein [Ruminococcus sp.]MCM1478928.1 hypothetical protein [Muribaculaceae bacterium]
MASAKMEYELEVNRKRMSNIRKSLKFGFLASVAASGAAVLILGVYYFIRALAGLAGASLLIGELYVKAYLDGDTPAADNLVYEYPYGFMAYILLLTILAIFSYVTKKKGYNTALLIAYGLGGIYGLLGLIWGDVSKFTGVYLLVVGGLGVWLEIYLLGVYKELDWLSLQDGFPDFIPLLTESKTMSNTTGLTAKRSDFEKRSLQDKKRKNEYVSAGSAEMEELTLDTELPKSNRKIDNMM